MAAHRRCSTSSSPRASSRSRTPASSSARPRPRRTSPSPGWSSAQQRAGRRHDARIPTSPASCHCGRRQLATVNTGRLFISLKPRDERASQRRPDHQPAAPASSPRCRARRSSCRRARTSTSAAASARTQYQYTLQDAESRRAQRLGAEHAGEAAGAAAAAGRHHRPADRRHRRLIADHRPRRSRALRHPPQLIDDTLYDAFGQRQVTQYFTQLNQLPRDPGGRARAAGRPATLSASSTCKSPLTGQQVPLSTFVKFDTSTRASCRSTTRASSRR